MQVDPFTVRPNLPSQERHLLELLGCPSVQLGHGWSGRRSPTPAPIKRPTVSHEGPDRARHLVRECHDRDVLWSSRQHASEPRVHHPISSTLRQQYAASTVDQQRSQVRIAALADAEQLHPPTGARLPWYQTQEGRKLSPGAEAARIGHRRDHRRGREPADPRDCGKPLTLPSRRRQTPI